MAIALGSLMTSDTTLLNELALLTFTGVMVDTFLIRPMLCPAIMAMFPALNWWPREFSGTLEVDDMREDADTEPHGAVLERENGHALREDSF